MSNVSNIRMRANRNKIVYIKSGPQYLTKPQSMCIYKHAHTRFSSYSLYQNMLENGFYLIFKRFPISIG